MNYINKDKNYMTDAEWIRYLEESIRELRIEKDRIRKEKWEYHHKIIELEKENRNLKEERIFSLWERDYMILTSTTPQLKLTKKDNSDLCSNITEWTTQK